ncbi:MAG: carotenoid 1,2-hydratase [Gammaproteobacteria bacterium]|nr:carotenoid 1,2-hydratase [Gammaproteobacteria bacterium]
MARVRLIICGLLIVLITLSLRVLFTDRDTAPPVHENDLAGVLGDSAGYAQADRARRFRFPADFGAHPDFRQEWWYFTGNLQAADGRRFGYELTLFRIALSPNQTPGRSAWRTDQLYTAHLALTDRQEHRFECYERFSRGAMGLAGARTAPFRVWLEDWRVAARPGGGFPWRLEANAGNWRLALALSPQKPLVLQGNRGLDRKSAKGHASYYYSFTRLSTVGTLTLDGEIIDLNGLSWLDREWSSGSLADDQQGWDWFALQLNDGADIMFYRLRDTRDATDPNSGGVWVDALGNSVTLVASDVRIETLAHWSSPRGGRYPARWRLTIPACDCRLIVTPIMADQELDVLVRYWEGAVDVTGLCGTDRVSGMGYVELTGYAERT